MDYLPQACGLVSLPVSLVIDASDLAAGLHVTGHLVGHADAEAREGSGACELVLNLGDVVLGAGAHAREGALLEVIGRGFQFLRNLKNN